MRGRLATVLALAALVAAGCGGEEAQKPPKKPELSVPGGGASPDGPPGTGDTTTTGPTTTGPTTTEPEPAPTPGAADTTSPAPADTTSPDSAVNDTPPPPGSSAERFEEFCDQNAGFCE